MLSCVYHAERSFESCGHFWQFLNLMWLIRYSIRMRTDSAGYDMKSPERPGKKRGDTQNRQN